MPVDGWCPFARQHRGPGEGPFGYPAGERRQNRPIMFVDHRMGGYKRTLDNDRWRHDNWTGVHAGIGRDGSIDQYASILDASWGNGVGRPISMYDRTNSRLAALERLGSWRLVTLGTYSTFALVKGEVNILNTHSISIEHEDYGADMLWTPSMITASINFKRWCLEELERAGIPMEVGDDMLVGHFQIDATDRAGCPGRYWPKNEMLEALMNAPTKEEFGQLYALVLGVRDALYGLADYVVKDKLADDAEAMELVKRIDAVKAQSDQLAAKLSNP